MVEQKQFSEKIDRHTAAVEYILTVVADVENVSAIVADYLTFYTNFKLKYGIEDEEKVNKDELESKIEEQDIINLTNKAYAVKANLIKLYTKLKALAENTDQDTKELEDAYNKIKNNVILKDEWVENFLLHANLIIQRLLLSGVFDVVKKWGKMRSIEKA